MNFRPPQILVERAGAVWTLHVNGKMLLRSVDGAGIRQMAAHLRKHLSRPGGQAAGSV